MKPRLYAGFWWMMRVYVVLFAGFIAAFGAFRWRLPAYRRRYERVGRDTSPEANTPSFDKADVPLPETHIARPWVIAIGLILLIGLIWVIVAIVA